jgi:hypothetical protein
MRFPRWSGPKIEGRVSISVPVWWPGPPTFCLLLGELQTCPLHWCERGNGQTLRGELAPCVTPTCDFCTDKTPSLTYGFAPAMRWNPTPETGQEWHRIVLGVSPEGCEELAAIVKKQRGTRGLAVHISRNGRLTSGRQHVAFARDLSSETTTDSFDVRKILESRWQRWLRDPPPDWKQPVLPFPEDVELNGAHC